MGGSLLGEECDRRLYWSYKRPFVVKDARIQRIFDMGNRIEDYILDLLREAGITVYDKDENGEQYGFKDEELAGHSDGVLVGLPDIDSPALFECKSAKNSTFNQFVKKGVREVNNKYFVQTQVYMKYLNLKYCLFIVMNKDNQELYQEIIKYEPQVADIYIQRGKDIARAKELPARAYNSSTFFKCRMCEFNEDCWEAE